MCHETPRVLAPLASEACALLVKCVFQQLITVIVKLATGSVRRPGSGIGTHRPEPELGAEHPDTLGPPAAVLRTGKAKPETYRLADGLQRATCGTSPVRVSEDAGCSCTIYVPSYIL